MEPTVNRGKEEDRFGMYSGGRANRALPLEMMGEGQGVGKGKSGIKEVSEAGACSLPRHRR